MPNGKEDNLLIAYCGLDCAKCPAWIATKNNDQPLREKTAKEWSEWNHAEITPEMITCEGCRVNGKKFPFCESMCPIRQCALGKDVRTCGGCGELDTCQKIKMIIDTNPDALARLKEKN